MEEMQEKMVSLEDVCNFLNDHLYTGITTGDYDYGQPYIVCTLDTMRQLLDDFEKTMED